MLNARGKLAKDSTSYVQGAKDRGLGAIKLVRLPNTLSISRDTGSTVTAEPNKYLHPMSSPELFDSKEDENAGTLVSPNQMRQVNYDIHLLEYFLC